MTRTPNLIVGTFEGPSPAHRAVRELLGGGAAETDIGVVMADSSEARELLEQGPGKPGEGAALGLAVGGTLGSVAAFAMAGPFGVLAAGPIAALLAGVTAGASAGGLLGALVGLGIPENEAALRVDAVRQGGVVVTCPARTDAEAERVRAVFAENGARDVFRV